MRINRQEIIDFFKAGKKAIGDLFVKAFEKINDENREEAFSNAIQIGIQNTVAALYSANVKDEEIFRVMNEHWGICKQEATEWLIEEKIQATIRSLRQYLKMNGFCEAQINSFMVQTNAHSKIKRHGEFWKLKDAPQKLKAELEK